MFLKAAHRQQGGDQFLAGNRQQLHDRRTLGGAAADRHPVGRHGIDHAPVAEQQQRIVVVAADEQFDALFALALGARLAAGAAAGGLKFAHRHALEVAGFGEQHHRALIGDQVDVLEATLKIKDLGAPGRVVAGP